MTFINRLISTALITVPACAWLAASASASKQVIAYFGTEAGQGSLGGEFSGLKDIAVNSSGAGPAAEGDIYVADANNNRIQRFAQDDNGTPANPYDDTYPFVSAWGIDVDSATVGGNAYEVCVVATSCKAAVATGGNGGASGNGGMSNPYAVAVDQDSGDVYVTDKGNRRIDVYSGDGTFLRAFGFDVVQSGPGDNGTGYEVCVAGADVCKAGVSGSGVGQLNDPAGIAISSADGGAATGTVFVADDANHRVTTFKLDGTAPSSFGSSANFQDTSPEQVAVDSRGIVYASDRANTSEIERYDSQNANGVGVGFLAPIPAPPLSTENIQRKGLEVDSDSDGAGPDTDVLYVVRDGAIGTTVVQQFGPVNAPGLTVPPAAEDDRHGLNVGFNFIEGLGFDESSGRLFVSDTLNIGGPYEPAGEVRSGVYVLDTAGGQPSAGIDSVGPIGPTSATVNATVNPNGGPPVKYKLEYSLDGVDWQSTPEVVVGSQETPQTIAAQLNPPGGGLEPGTLYHVRLVATKVFTPPVTTAEKTFTTAVASPEAETTGSPVRTATAVRFEGRVNPRGTATQYHFEYGTEGPCDATACGSTAPLAAGGGTLIEQVSQEVGGLQPGTTYHYRLVADNGNPGSPVFGGDMTVTMRASDAPLTHGHFPGPPGSDRAWEQVNVPDTGGNPVVDALGISDDAGRVAYQLPGGTPITDSGSGYNLLFAERSASGWSSQPVLPPRDEVAGPNWSAPFSSNDLSKITSLNSSNVTLKNSLWRLSPGAPPTKLVSSSTGEYGGFYAASDDGSRAVEVLIGSKDPDHAGVDPKGSYMYDVSTGTPRMVSLLPGDIVPPCGVSPSDTDERLPPNYPTRESHWLSPDGSLVFFPSAYQGTCSPQGDFGGAAQLFERDLGAGTTTEVTRDAVSGEYCGSIFLKSTPDAVFFWTRSRLAPEDTAATTCNGTAGGDLYRYDLGDGSRECVTCLVPGIDTDVSNPATQVAVADDGSRVYFISPHRLVAGAPADGGIYRVDVQSGDLRFVASAGAIALSDPSKLRAAISPDGSVFVFRSAEASLNPVNGTDNGGTAQYYLYADADRSLLCVSCPQDGSAPPGSVDTLLRATQEQAGPNIGPLAADGTFAFSTATSLVGGDQNTAGSGQEPLVGTDIYEWRDGRPLLVSDGLTSWTQEEITPSVAGISPSGRDVFFLASAQLTPDALDGYQRLYDARIGGGFDFPQPPEPCPLEACQGTPKGTPSGEAPASADFVGPGNVLPVPGNTRCAKGKRKVRQSGKTRCVPRHHKKRTKKKQAKRTNHGGRAGR